MPAPRSETDDVLEYEVRVAARPETVFAYFTDPAKMIQWMGTEATLDPRPGGICRINPTGALAMLGEFVEIDPPRRIVFTWGWEREMFATPPQSTVVEVSFTPDANGTIIHLAHRRLLPGAVRFHQAGWDHYLPRLAVVAAGGDPSRDPWQDPEKALRDLALSPSPEAE